MFTTNRDNAVNRNSYTFIIINRCKLFLYILLLELLIYLFVIIFVNIINRIKKIRRS